MREIRWLWRVFVSLSVGVFILLPLGLIAIVAGWIEDAADDLSEWAMDYFGNKDSR